MNIKSELFIATKLSNYSGYTWTISSRLGDALNKAQELFGERDKDYTILGVEFVLSGKPNIWYPGDCKNIVIQLTKDALGDVGQALYQLSHEIVHCLSPNGKNDTNILEEGIATWFSEWYMQEIDFGPWYPRDPMYAHAIELVKHLLAIDDTIIKKVRQITPTISELKPDDFLQIHPHINKGLLDLVCRPFNAKTGIYDL